MKRPIGTEQNLARRFIAILKSWGTSKVEEANQSPLFFAFALAELLCAERMPRLRERKPLERFCSEAFRGDRDFLRYGFELEANELETSLLTHRDSLAKTLQSLSNFQLDAPDDGSLDTSISRYKKAVILDYETILKTANDNLQAFYTTESRASSHLATLDDLRVAEQSESFGQLTFLAFLFIPLSFVTSLFGMNLQFLNSGSATVKSFLIASTGTMATVVTLLFLAPLVSSFACAVRRALGGLWLHRRELRKMAIITPVGAFWLFLYGLTHNPGAFALLIQELGILDVLFLHQDWKEPEFINSERTTFLSKFWAKRIIPIAEITKHRGWHETTAWQRWRDRRALNTAVTGPHSAHD